jgi:hypothetical protein
MNRFWIFLDVQGNIVNYIPASSEYTSYEIDGEDHLPELATNEKQFEYVSGYSTSDNSNPNNPSKRLKEYYSFSNYTFSVGFRYNIFD